MPGLWLTRIARRLTQPDTFERLVSPAIADLQLESQRTWLGRWRHYPALIAVLAWALLRDFGRELAYVFNASAWQTVWSRAFAWALVAAGVNWIVIYGLLTNELTRLQATDTARQIVLDAVMFRSVGPALTVAMIVAAYNFKRREAGHTGTVVAATMTVAAVTVVSTFISTMLQAPATQALTEAGRAFYGSNIEVTRAPLPWQLATNALSMIPFAWLGVVLARRRGWSLAVIASVILGSWQVLNFTAFPIYAWFARLIPGLDALLFPLLFGKYGLPTNLLTLVGLILLWRAVERVVDPADIAHAS